MKDLDKKSATQYVISGAEYRRLLNERKKKENIRANPISFKWSFIVILNEFLLLGHPAIQILTEIHRFIGLIIRRRGKLIDAVGTVLTSMIYDTGIDAGVRTQLVMRNVYLGRLVFP